MAVEIVYIAYRGITGIFLAYFIANIGSYSQLKIVSFFPIGTKKFPVVIKNRIKCSTSFETRATSLTQCLNN